MNYFFIKKLYFKQKFLVILKLKLFFFQKILKKFIIRKNYPKNIHQYLC